ncbi:MAG: pitrilysin family protein [Dehalococcoidia bacterium]|nr:pitrilysin family protein [Dehalococcoidia bacterium]
MEPIIFEKFTLPNGLDVILHQDSSLPLVSVNVWYHVGSRNEEPGKTGFAHLFEHVMFEGSKNHNRSFFEPLQKIGANLNGSTTPDRTNYWENLPSSHLELALWLEADRMGFLLDALDQRRFDIQRDVVKNERRQSYENRPYGMADILLQEATYPPPHPYHWPTIGYTEDLDAASLEDVEAFFRRFYTPTNASLCIAGDIQPDRARELVERYFWDIAPGERVPRPHALASSLKGGVRRTMYDRVTLARSYIVWPAVPRLHPDEPALSLLAFLLGDGRSSRLHRALVYERKIAQNVSAHYSPASLAGDFQVEVTVAAGHSAREVEEAALAEIERLRTHAPTSEELARAKNHVESRIVRQMASVGGFSGRANRLNSFNVFAGDPGLINHDLDRYLAVQPENIQRAAEAYLRDTNVRLFVLPQASKADVFSPADRAVEPQPAAAGTFLAPVPQRQRLPNGLDVLVVENHTVPLVAFGLVITAGAVADLAQPGLAAFTTAMLQEGTDSRTSSQIADEFEFIGSRLSAGPGREHTVFATETLSRYWPKALELVADLMQRATFPAQELERLRRERLTNIRRQRDDAASLAATVGPALLLGGGSPFGHPIVGTESSITAMSREQMVKFYQSWFGPKNTTLVVAGDTSINEVVKLAEQYLGSWRANGTPSDMVATPSATQLSATTLFVLDKPGAAQSVIRVGAVSVPRHHPDYFAITLLNSLFGDQFTSRLNSNLRQDKGYSYGYRCSIDWYRNGSLVQAGGAVQTTVTPESVRETLKEFREIAGSRPVETLELDDARTSLLRQLPSAFETPSQTLDQLARLVAFDLPADYYRTAPARYEDVSLADIRRVAREWIDLDRLAILVVGDRAVVESGLQKLGLPLLQVDHEGRNITTI